MKTRVFAAILALATTASTAAVAAQTAPEACLADERDFNLLMTSLEAEGWTAIMPGEPIPEAATESIALARTVFYATTDRGGASLDQIMDLQRRTVPGFARRVDTDLAKVRVLTRGDDAMTLNWSQPQAGKWGIVEVICRIASSAGRAATGTEEGFDDGMMQTLAEEPLRRIGITALEPALLAELTTDDTTRAIIETVSVLPPLEE
ncbi:MAG: hypothetical protein AAFR53_03885 [Pseudomonadota bacterium]